MLLIIYSSNGFYQRHDYYRLILNFNSCNLKNYCRASLEIVILLHPYVFKPSNYIGLIKTARRKPNGSNISFTVLKGSHKNNPTFLKLNFKK